MRTLMAALALLLAASPGFAADVVDAARRGLASESSVTRVGACRSLGASGERRAIPPLLEALLDEAAPVRVAAIDALGRLGDEVAVPRLVRALRDTSAMARGRALIAIGRLGGPYVGAHVVPYLADQDPGVRICAVKALGALGDPLRADVVRALLDRTEKDPGHWLLATAIVALTQLEGRRSLDGLFVRAGEVRAFDSWLVRSSLIWAVGMTADGDRLPFVERGFASDDDRVAGAAATALLALGATELVIATLEHADAARRRLAVAALAGTGDRRWRDKLLARADDPSARVRLEAALGLSKMGVPEAFPLLVQGLASRWALVWGASAHRLARAYGVDHGRDPEAWIAWFREVRERLEWDPEARVWRET